MHYGLEIVPVGPLSDPCKVVQLAQATEAAGWEGITDEGPELLLSLWTGEETTQAGATWWFEAIFLSRASEDELLRRIEAGPPQ